jgi:hypothetical protein
MLLTATIILAIWAAVGPIGGIYLGADIAHRNQRKQWLSDCKKEEYSSLLSAVTQSAMTLATRSSVRAPEDQRAEWAAEKRVGEVAFASIFIAPTIKRLKVTQRWQEALSTSTESNKFTVLTGELIEDIRAEAAKDI